MPDLIGHERILSFFDRAMETGNLHHAFLFVGPEHVGKTTLIEGLILRLVGAGVNPNVYRVGLLVDEKTGKQATSISVEQIRQLREAVSLTAFGDTPKVVFVEEAGEMSDSASNALLKLLEEPPARTYFFLRANDLAEILPTIRSRAQVIRALPVSQTLLTRALQDRGAAEVDAQLYAAFANGCPGLALSLLQKEEAAGQKFDDVREAFESLSKPLGVQWVASVKSAPNILPAMEAALRQKMLASVSQSEPLGVWARAFDTYFESKQAAAAHVQPAFALEHFYLSL